MITIHAPSRNFVLTTTTVTTKVVAAPSAFSPARQRQPGSFDLCQCRTIPACARVNAVNTPITYRWISEFTLARKATSRPVASPASTRIPFEYARRSPRLTNWLGREGAGGGRGPGAGGPRADGG